MTVAPGKVRVQVAIPAALKAEMEQLAAAAGVSVTALAAVFLAAGVAHTRPPSDSLVDEVPRQRMSRATRRKSSPESEARQDDDDWEDGFTAAEILAAMPAEDRDALLAQGWTPELIDDVLNGPDEGEEEDARRMS